MASNTNIEGESITLCGQTPLYSSRQRIQTEILHILKLSRNGDVFNVKPKWREEGHQAKAWWPYYSFILFFMNFCNNLFP